jgi:hypothetical protein
MLVIKTAASIPAMVFQRLEKCGSKILFRNGIPVTCHRCITVSGLKYHWQVPASLWEIHGCGNPFPSQ